MKFYRSATIGTEAIVTAIHGTQVSAKHWRNPRLITMKTYNEDPKDYFDDPKSIKERIETVTVQPTKRGILKALQIYASHPDNG